jgi:hypothetical protein
MVSQLKVNEIIKQSGSSISIGESGDTITLPSTATLTNFPDNKPFFRAYSAGGFTAAADTYTNFADTEVFDIGGCYDTSTKRFTPDVAGYYCFNVHARTNSTSNFSYISARIRKNGAEISSGVHATVICQLNGSTDYVEGMIYCNTTGRDFYANKNTNSFMGFRLIGE